MESINWHSLALLEHHINIYTHKPFVVVSVRCSMHIGFNWSVWVCIRDWVCKQKCVFWCCILWFAQRFIFMFEKSNCVLESGFQRYFCSLAIISLSLSRFRFGYFFCWFFSVLQQFHCVCAVPFRWSITSASNE